MDLGPKPKKTYVWPFQFLLQSSESSSGQEYVKAGDRKDVILGYRYIHYYFK